MTRYIIVDNMSGYIWGDTAAIPEWATATPTPIEACRIVDKFNGDVGRQYKEVPRLHLTELGYKVYRPKNSDIEIGDGTDRRTINRVRRHCELAAIVKTVSEHYF